MSSSSWRTHALAGGDDPAALIDREWLLTNGTGAFAMGTAAGANTRRYHGLLVAATEPPVGRVVLLNQVFEQLILRPQHDDQPHQTLELATCIFRDDRGQRVYVPRGYTMLQHFDRGLGAVWTYRWGAITFTRELILHWKQQAATIWYRVEGLAGACSAARLVLNPMLTLRDFHSLLHAHEAGPLHWDQADGSITVRRGDLAMTLACPGAHIERRDQWWYDVEYPLEARRGQDDKEDYFIPAALICEIEAPKVGQTAQWALTVSLGDKPVKPRRDAARRAKHLEPIVRRLAKAGQVSVSLAGDGDCALDSSREKDAKRLARCLAIAADDFVVDRTVKGRKLSTIIAGYPWFADWGRDTFIALRGLLLATGRYDQAKAVLAAFAHAIDHGLVPNRFDDYHQQAAHYNTVDASLWFVQAAIDYLDASRDTRAWNDWLAAACVSVIQAYIQGTGPDRGDGRPMIAMAEDSLIAAGTGHTQLTWMDAAVGDRVFTPRQGKAVEINALWYNALVQLAGRLPSGFAQQAAHYRQLAARVKRSFTRVFWDEDQGRLADHVWDDAQGRPQADWSMRPNQIFAVAVEHSPLAQVRRKKVLAAVREALLTPMGLCTLPPGDANYHGRYVGDQYHRDQAYHQGTAWPWLIGPYAEAVLRTGGFSAKSRREALNAIAPLVCALVGSGVQLVVNGNGQPGAKPVTADPAAVTSIGQLAEIHEADPPHRAVGCMAQAWSVAEVLRVYEMLNHPTADPSPRARRKSKK